MLPTPASGAFAQQALRLSNYMTPLSYQKFRACLRRRAPQVNIGEPARISPTICTANGVGRRRLGQNGGVPISEVAWAHADCGRTTRAHSSRARCLIGRR